MSAEDTATLRKEGRVVRLFPGRVREQSEMLSDVSGTSNDTATSLSARAEGGYATVPQRGRLLDGASPASPQRGQYLDEVRARLDHDFESRLCEPLSRIATVAAVLKHELNDHHAEQIGAIVDAAERSDRMLKDMLGFVRSATGGTTIVRRRVDLKLLCERVVDAIHTSHPDHPMLFSCDSRLEGQFDPDAIASLLWKLVLNAIEHGPARPAIRVELRGLANDVVLDVWNAGPALDATLAAQLFEPFVCGRSRLPGHAEGLGLGLHLMREIVRAHGGRIDVQSSDSEGTTFQVTLPRW